MAVATRKRRPDQHSTRQEENTSDWDLGRQVRNLNTRVFKNACQPRLDGQFQAQRFALYGHGNFPGGYGRAIQRGVDADFAMIAEASGEIGKFATLQISAQVSSRITNP